MMLLLLSSVSASALLTVLSPYATASLQEPDGVSTDWSGYTVRMAVAPEHFDFAGTHIRLTARAWSNRGFTASRVWIGKKGSGDHDFAATPTEVLWGGASGVDLGVAEEAVSDDLPFAYDPATDSAMVIAVEVAASTTLDDMARFENRENWSSVSKAAIDGSTLVASGYADSSNDAVLFSRVEMRTANLPVSLWRPVQAITDGPGSFGWGGFTARTVVDKANLRRVGTKMRLTVTARTSSPTIIDDFFIGLQSGSIAYESTPLRVTWGGSNGINLASGESVVSDEIALPFDPGSNLGIVFAFYRATATSDDYLGVGSVAGWDTFYKSGNDAAGTAGTGYSVGTRDAVAVSLIEFYGSPEHLYSWVGAFS